MQAQPSANDNDGKKTKSEPDIESAPGAAVETNAKAVKLKGSVLDSRKESTADGIVIPAGTQIRVDGIKHTVVVPVRVGFATPIPALSGVKLETSRSNFNTTNATDGVPLQSYTDYTILTSVTVNGATYPLKTDVLPLLTGATNTELVFTLREPVTIR